jgi:hypothetical protein
MLRGIARAAVREREKAESGGGLEHR